MNARKPLLIGLTGLIIGLSLYGIGIWLSVDILQSFGILTLFIITPVLSIRPFRESMFQLIFFLVASSLAAVAFTVSLALLGLLFVLCLVGIYLIYLLITWIF